MENDGPRRIAVIRDRVLHGAALALDDALFLINALDMAALGLIAGEAQRAQLARDLAAAQAEAQALRGAIRAAGKDLALAQPDTPGAGAIVMSVRWTLADALKRSDP